MQSFPVYLGVWRSSIKFETKVSEIVFNIDDLDESSTAKGNFFHGLVVIVNIRPSDGKPMRARPNISAATAKRRPKATSCFVTPVHPLADG